MGNKQSIKYINLNEITNPNFVKDLTSKELDVLSEDIRQEIINQTSIHGGHLSSNLGVVESTIALCNAFDFNKDKIIFDVGHQSYTYKILTGRSLNTLREKDGVCGFQRMEESVYDHFDAGHSSTSISIANGFAIARDIQKKDYNVIAFVGDSSISNGLAFEGMNNASQGNHKIIVVLNDNEMSISRPAGGLAKAFRRFSTSTFYLGTKRFYKKTMLNTKVGKVIYAKTIKLKDWLKRHIIKITIFDSLGFSVIGPIDGHNIKAMTKAFERAKKQDKCTLVYLKTIKGKGYKYSEGDDLGLWHGVGPFNKETGEFVKKDNGTKTWSTLYANELANIIENNNKSVLISPATELGSGLSKLFSEYPDRCIDVGIAEEHALTLCGSISKGGCHPFVSIYSTFLQRAYDEINHDIARTNQNATLLIDRAGLVGKDGSSHQGIFDESFLINMPNTVVTMASRPSLIKGLLYESMNNHGVFSIRYPRDEALPPKENEYINFGSWIKEASLNKDVAVVSAGPLVEKIKPLIGEKATLYNAVYLKPMDENAINDLLTFKKIVIYNPYATEQGFANELINRLVKERYKGDIISRCIPLEFVKHASIEDQWKEYGLLPEQLMEIL